MTLFLVGCSSFELKRLAPGGLVRYERIADEKEANPAIVEEIERFRAKTDAEFPIIGDTAAGKAERMAPPTDGVDIEMKRLSTIRDDIEKTLDADRDAAGEDRKNAAEMSKEAQKLEKAITASKVAAARDQRAAPIEE